MDYEKPGEFPNKGSLPGFLFPAKTQ